MEDFLATLMEIYDILNRRYSYGYVTNTKIKFVIVVESSNTALRDNEIRSVGRSMYFIILRFSNNIQI